MTDIIDHAAHAADAVNAYCDVTSAELPVAFNELLADLMFWCDREGYDFDKCLEDARNTYQVEKLDGVQA